MTIAGVDEALDRVVAAVARAAEQHPDRVRELLPARGLRGAAYLGFEMRLADRDAPLELAYSLTDAELLRLAYEDAPEDERISEVCRLWGETGDPPFSDGGAIWLEYESPKRGARRRRALFFGLPAEERPQRPCGRDLRWALDTLVPAASGRSLRPAACAAVMRAAALAPPETARIQLGLGLDHGPAAVRCCVFGVPPHAARDYLEAVGWPGDLAAADDAVARYGDLCDSLALDLDIADTVLPALGIELLYHGSDPWQWQPPGERRWNTLFDRLVDEGLSLPSRRDALLGWPARVPVGAPPIERLVAAVDGREPPAGGILVSGLQHVKLTLRATGPTAKAYFGVRVDAGAIA